VLNFRLYLQLKMNSTQTGNSTLVGFSKRFGAAYRGHLRNVDSYGSKEVKLHPLLQFIDHVQIQVGLQHTV
jgi:hypothetical protein